VQLHLGVDPDFHPAGKAHPAFVVDDLDALAERLAAAGAPVRWSDEIPGVRRFHTEDPVGNRLELIAAH
jgi:predicted enzyme related to lactoylglutathione lyase